MIPRHSEPAEESIEIASRSDSIFDVGREFILSLPKGCSMFEIYQIVILSKAKNLNQRATSDEIRICPELAEGMLDVLLPSIH
jgi:hypothetical protein